MDALIEDFTRLDDGTLAGQWSSKLMYLFDTNDVAY